MSKVYNNFCKCGELDYLSLTNFSLFILLICRVCAGELDLSRRGYFSNKDHLRLRIIDSWRQCVGFAEQVPAVAQALVNLDPASLLVHARLCCKGTVSLLRLALGTCSHLRVQLLLHVRQIDALGPDLAIETAH